MAQKITLQDGTVIYSASDTTQSAQVIIRGIPKITTDPDESLTINGDISVTFSTNGSDKITINQDGSLEVGGTVGAPGYVLTSLGPGASPVWAPGGGGGGTSLSVSVSGGSVHEKGETVTSVSVSWSYSGPIIDQTITDYPGLPVDDRTHDFLGLSLTSNKTYTVTATDGVASTNGSTSVEFFQRRYWGASAATSLTNADILALSSEFATSEPKTVTYNCSGGKYPYYCYPASWGAPNSVLVGGFWYSDYTVTQVAFTNASGYTDLYNVIRFNGIQTAPSLLVVWG